MSLARRSDRPAPTPPATYVVFSAAGRRLALSTRQVAAVAELEAFTSLEVPGRPEVLGLVAHRGRALPLFDLGLCLGAPGTTADGGEHCVIVAEGERCAAFPVAALEGLARVAGETLPPGCESFDPGRVVFARGEPEEGR
jgi:chemotaxis signal transduction protein